MLDRAAERREDVAARLSATEEVIDAARIVARRDPPDESGATHAARPDRTTSDAARPARRKATRAADGATVGIAGNLAWRGGPAARAAARRGRGRTLYNRRGGAGSHARTADATRKGHAAIARRGLAGVNTGRLAYSPVSARPAFPCPPSAASRARARAHHPGETRPMNYTSITAGQREEMLAAIGASSIDDLFAVIPEKSRLTRELDLPPALSELELQREIASLSSMNRHMLNSVSFMGAGAYDHFIPAFIDQMVNRGEILTA